MTRYRRSPLDALRAALAPAVRPDIDLDGLVDLDAQVPCDGLWNPEAGCERPAVWLMLAACPGCRKTARALYCEEHRAELLSLRSQLTSRCCLRRDFTWRWQPL